MKQWVKLKGFTFVEIMVVCAMLSIVGLVVSGVLVNGINLWDRVNRVVLEEDIAIFFHKLTDDLKNTIYFNGINFKGGDISFAIPAVITNEDGLSLPGRITYYFDQSCNSINRKHEDYAEIYQNKSSEGEIIISNVESVKILYYAYFKEENTYEWLDEWQTDGIPQAVKMEVVLKTEGGNNKFIKTISIPVSKIEPVQA